VSAASDVQDGAGGPGNFPIVGIGASAGGLAAIEAFFAAMPRDKTIGVAFVLVQHLSPDHKSILIDLVKRYTGMPVFLVEDGMKVQTDCIYVIPPNRDMALLNGKLQLLEPGAPRGLRLPIDFFFRSLAQDRKERAICIVLSGTGTGGSLGLKVVKGEGGMAMAQTLDSAAYDRMPRSAILTGVVDYVLPPAKMPEQLIAYVARAFRSRPQEVVSPQPAATDFLQKIFLLLRTRTTHDFSLYKRNTVQRRVERRMAVAQIERIEDYVHYLRDTPLEVDTLFRELLIGVTGFFRDPQAFESLREHVIGPHLSDASRESMRIWVPGCSTGEEAYSIAILVREHPDQQKKSTPVQIFATDIDIVSIERARSGVYPESIAADVSTERLDRFFTRDESSYRIHKDIRDMVVFAKQDVLKDPPFSKLDLITCRNLLIYLDAEAQKMILPMFHYALNRNGHLLLCNSETVGEFSDLFAAVDKKWKLYRQEGAASPRAAGATDRAGDAERRVAPCAAGARSVPGQVLRPVRPCAGGVFHRQRAGADPRGESPGGRSAGRGKNPAGEAASDPLYRPGGSGRLLPAPQAPAGNGHSAGMRGADVPPGRLPVLGAAGDGRRAGRRGVPAKEGTGR
jgi:two-component system CheB/CheR fusion protein